MAHGRSTPIHDHFTMADDKPPQLSHSEESLTNDSALAKETLGKETSDSINTVEKGSATALPLRPTLHDRYNHILIRLLPKEHYFHPKLTRRRFSFVLLALLFLLLLLIIILPVALTRKGGARKSVPLPTGKQTYTGEGTYYDPAMGACGIVSGPGDMIVAISWQLFDSQGGPNPNLNPFCGRKIRAKGIGRSGGVEVKVVDRCTGCAPTDLDFSPEAFKGIGEKVDGRVGIEWAWV